VREAQQTLMEAGGRLWDLEVPEDEGGITPPLAEAASEDELSTQTEPDAVEPQELSRLQ